MEQRGRGLHLALAQAEAQEVPSFMMHQLALVWERRTRMLSTVCAVSFVGSLVEPSHADVCVTEGDMPSLSEVLTHDPRYF